MKYELSKETEKHCSLNFSVASCQEIKQQEAEPDKYSKWKRLAGEMKIIIRPAFSVYEVIQPSGVKDHIKYNCRKKVSCDVCFDDYNSWTNIAFNDNEANAIFKTVGRCLEARFSRGFNNND